MTTEEIKNECIQRGEYTIKAFSNTFLKSYLGIYGFATSIPLWIIGIICTFAILFDDFRMPIEGWIAFTFIFCISLLLPYMFIPKIKILLKQKNDIIKFTKQGITYIGYEKNFDVKWNDVSNVNFIEIINKNIVNIYYTIHTIEEKTYKFDTASTAINSLDKWVWLTNYFSGKDIFDAEKQTEIKDKLKKTSPFLAILGISSSIIAGTIYIISMFDETNAFVEFPQIKFSWYWILSNFWYLFIVIEITILFLDCFLRNGKSKKNSLLSKINQSSIIVSLVSMVYLIFIIHWGIIQLNKISISTPEYKTEKVIINGLKEVQGGRRTLDSYYAQVYLINDTNFFEIEINSESYYKYREKDTLELKIFKGSLGLTIIDNYNKINLPNNFSPEKFSIKGKNIYFSPSNIHTKIADNRLYWSNDIKQYEVVNIHYKKGEKYEHSNKDLYAWYYYAEKSTYEEQELSCYPFSRAEITYILKERPNAEKLHFLASVEGINGLVILPDKWDITDIHDDEDIPDSLKITPTTGVMKYSANVFTDAQWGVMQYYGAIFLPAAGYSKVKTTEYKNDRGEYRTKKEVQNKYENQKGYYWTSDDKLREGSKACCLVFSEDRIDVMQLDKSYHCSIRMIMKY